MFSKFSKEDWAKKPLDERVNIVHLGLVAFLFFIFWPLGIVALLAKQPLSKYIKEYIDKYSVQKSKKEERKSSVTNKVHGPGEVPRSIGDTYQPNQTLPSFTPGQDIVRNILAVLAALI